MNIVLALVVAGIFALWALSRTRQDPLALAEQAVRTGEMSPVLAALRRLPAGSRPTEYHRVIRRLWDGYHREEAVHLAKVFAREHRDAAVAHFWLRQFQQLEPEIAAKHLDPEYLAAYFDPAVAACCGSYG